MGTYPIFEVAADAPEVTESLGTKRKFWYESNRYLFKAGREGEDWAEKVSAEVAEKIGLPHAHYDLAVWHLSDGSVDGVRSHNFSPSDAILILGNELLSQLDPEYSAGVTRFHHFTHTLGRAKTYLTHPFIPVNIGSWPLNQPISKRQSSTLPIPITACVT